MINFPAIQFQHRENNCGLFALAFATSLCYGENPSEITYTTCIHKHLVLVLKQKIIQIFFP